MVCIPEKHQYIPTKDRLLLPRVVHIFTAIELKVFLPCSPVQPMTY